jgi:hypothetical protein
MLQYMLKAHTTPIEFLQLYSLGIRRDAQATIEYIYNLAVVYNYQSIILMINVNG